MANEHDALFKNVFSVPEHARAELQRVLPEALSRAIAWETLRLAPSELTDDLLDERRADVLLSVEVARHEVFLYLLFEHKSTVDPLACFKVLAQMVRIWERWSALTRTTDRLPVILPILVHHSERGWTAATDLRDLFYLPPELAVQLAPWLPSVPILLDDLSHEDDQELRSRGSALLAIALFCLQRARSSPALALEFGPEWAPIFASAVAQWSGPNEPLTNILAYAVAVGRVRLAELNALLERMLGPDQRVGAIMDTLKVITQRLREQYRTEARAEGLAEGRAEGRAEGKADVLLTLLTTRYGLIPADVEARVRAAREPDLTTWATRVLTAASLDDVFRAS
jgi:predicted transposase YdaD